MIVHAIEHALDALVCARSARSLIITTCNYTDDPCTAARGHHPIWLLSGIFLISFVCALWFAIPGVLNILYSY